MAPGPLDAAEAIADSAARTLAATLAIRHEQSEARTVVDCDGDAVMETGIRAAYLREACAALDTVRVEIGSTGQPLQPMRLAGEHEHDLAVIMPMRI